MGISAKRVNVKLFLKKWESKDENLQEEVLGEVEFELSHDKVLEDHDWPELVD